MKEGRNIVFATKEDRGEILALYKSQIGREYCPWDEHYPGDEQITFDLSRNSLIVMKEDKRIIGAISIDSDEEVEKLECWSKELQPVAELSRLAVAVEYQNQGIARKLILHAMDVLRDRKYMAVHYIVNQLNVKALRSYEQLQFQKVGECRLFEQPFWCFEKAL